MGLEFNKLTDQVSRMGAMIERLDFDLGDQLRIARARFAAATDPEAVRWRVEFVRDSRDISGYRGAALLDGSSEPINMIHPAPLAPERARVVAVDGSQIYPDDRAPVHFYLLNIGIFIYHHGEDHLPQQITLPTLYFHKDHVHDAQRQVISNRTVDARRTVQEMQRLAQACWSLHREDDTPIIALYDNNLMFSINTDVTGGEGLLRDYRAAVQQLYDVQANGVRATLAGYVDAPRGSVVLRLLHLLSLADETEIKAAQKEIEAGGDLDGLRDRHLFQVVLGPGDRSAVMVQNSPRNLSYKQFNPMHEIAFFYINVGTAAASSIARVDVPMWVARDPAALDDLHALLLTQSDMQGRNPYPYALTRADELAYVSSKDKAKLDELIHLELRRKGIHPGSTLPKARGKELSRSDRGSYLMDTELK